MSITVKVGVVPGSINEFGLNDGAKVSDALSAARLSGAGYAITVNGEKATADTSLSNCDRILLTKSIKGNS